MAAIVSEDSDPIVEAVINQPPISFPPEYSAENQVPTDANLALFKSALAGSLTGVENALKKGGKPNFFHRPEDQKNALHVACENGNAEIVEILLKNGALYDAVAITHQVTPLCLAAQNAHAHIIRLLLTHIHTTTPPEALTQALSRALTHRNGYGNTCLHAAVRSGSRECVGILISASTSIVPPQPASQALNNSSSTSSLKGSSSTSQLVPANFTRTFVNMPNNKGSTALHFACYGEDTDANSIDIVRMLLNAGATVDAVDQKGNTPYLVCASSGRVDIMSLLVEAGADPTAVNTLGQSAHEIAQFYNRAEVMRMCGTDSPTKRFAAGGK